MFLGLAADLPCTIGGGCPPLNLILARSKAFDGHREERRDTLSAKGYSEGASRSDSNSRQLRKSIVDDEITAHVETDGSLSGPSVQICSDPSSDRNPGSRGQPPPRPRNHTPRSARVVGSAQGGHYFHPGGRALRIARRRRHCRRRVRISQLSGMPVKRESTPRMSHGRAPLAYPSSRGGEGSNHYSSPRMSKRKLSLSKGWASPLIWLSGSARML